jgi:hypothetical protein
MCTYTQALLLCSRIPPKAPAAHTGTAPPVQAVPTITPAPPPHSSTLTPPRLVLLPGEMPDPPPGLPSSSAPHSTAQLSAGLLGRQFVRSSSSVKSVWDADSVASSAAVSVLLRICGCKSVYALACLRW